LARRFPAKASLTTVVPVPGNEGRIYRLPVSKKEFSVTSGWDFSGFSISLCRDVKGKRMCGFLGMATLLI
jgi:hypothetical protein